MADFKPGDRVRGKISGDEYRIEFGPYGNDMYAAVGVTDGIGHALSGDSLEPIPADPRVDVVARLVCDRMNGEGTWAQTDGPSVDFYRDDARAVLAALDAHSEDAEIDRDFRERALSAVQPRRVRDAEGDVWELRGRDYWCDYASGGPMNYDELNGRYGPLEEI